MRVLFALLALAASTVSAQDWTGPNFYITGGDGTNYKFSNNGTIALDPPLNLIVGTTYKFVLNASMSTHPFGFSTSGDTTAPTGNVPTEDFSSSAKGSVTTSGACTPNTANTTWITTSGSETTNPCIISFTPPTNATGLVVYYRCGIHPNMVGTLTAVAAAAGSSTGGSSTGGSSTGGSSTAGSSTGTTTAPPTTPSSSTGKSAAAVLVPGAAAFIIAAINALFSA